MTTNITPIVKTKAILLWIACCMLFLSTTTGHTQTTVDTIPASQYFAKADTLLTHRKLDSAIVYFNKALPIYTKAKNWERVARSYNKISESLRRDKKYEESLINAKQALGISNRYLPKNNREKAYGYDNIGQYYYSKRLNYNTALEYYQKALKIKLTGFPENHLYVVDSYMSIGNALLMWRKYDEALGYYQKSLMIRKKKLGINHIETSTSYFNIGLTYDRKEEYNKALSYMDKALSIRMRVTFKDYKEIARYNDAIGRLYRKKGKYNKALQYLEKCLSMESQIYGDEHYNITEPLNQIGICYKYKGEYDKALDYFNRAINIRKKISYGKEIYFSGMHNNVGVAYKYKGEYDKALIYLKKALEINFKTKGENHYSVATNYNNIGNIYRLKGDYEQALNFYNKALVIRINIFDKNHSHIADSYNDIGKLFITKKKYDKALFYIGRALEIQQNVFGEFNHAVADCYVSLGNVYKKTKEYDVALENYQKALIIRQKVFGNHHPKVALSYNDIAKVYYVQKDYKNSLLYYEKAIESNTNTDQYLNPNVVLTTLSGKAKTYTSLYHENNDIDDLNQAIATYKRADTLINDIRQTFTTYQDKVDFAQKAKTVYQGAIQTQLLWYVTQKEQSVLERAFYYTEKSKANTLKELLSEANAKSFTGLPNDVLALEKELRIDKAFYQSKITDARSETTIDSSKITTYENKLFEINRRQDSLATILEKDYPRYFELKHENSIVSVTDIQNKLNERTTVVEFFTADSSTYVFTVSKDKMAVQEVSTPDLTGQIEQLREAITSQELSRYKTIAHELYTTLIHPIKDQFIGDDELIIVPDGPLWHCNFELLLTQKDGSNNPAALSYLLKDYAITYANAANLLFAKSRSEEPIEKRQECLAFSFSEGDQVTSTNTMSMATLRDAGGDLPGTREEIKAISDIIDGQYYFGSQAIETNFKKNAGQYTILHLALHGEVDNERPENSKLYFTKSKDTVEDNLLYSHELFALDIPAELTVLSACNTGTGKIAKGEGIMSLGSAFQYAGTKSLLLTRWEVSDQTTPRVMKYFYTNLKQGMNKAKALQQAKLRYLATADINRTQPFYWGAFYLVGDAAPMHFESTSLWYWILGLGCVGMLLWIGFWYKRRKI